MLRLTDQFLIAVPQVFDEGNVPGMKTMLASHYVDKERDRYERKIRKGVVYSAPSDFTDTKHMPIDPGLPNPKLFVGHDAIQQKIQEGYKWSNAQYHPGTTEGFKYISRADYGRLITAKDGDEVYFHPSVTEPENFQGIINGQELYRAQVHELIAVGTVPQGFYILVEPHLEANEQIGMVVGFEETDKMLEGSVRFTRKGSSFHPGQFVYFQEGSDWSFEIEGQRLFAMLEENLLLTLASL